MMNTSARFDRGSRRPGLQRAVSPGAAHDWAASPDSQNAPRLVALTYALAHTMRDTVRDTVHATFDVLRGRYDR